MKWRSVLSVAGSVVVTLSLAGVGRCAELPRPGVDDARVRRIVYSANQVATILVRRGTVTRVTLGEDERIEVAATGLSGRCDKDEDDWCIRAEAGSNQIYVRPKEGAAHTNMELKTNRRDYSLEFRVVGEKSSEKKRRGEEEQGFFRVVFEYPPAPVAVRAAALNGLLADVPAATGRQAPNFPSPRERLAAAKPRVANSNYTMQVLEKGEDAAPSLVFDDGRFTYFEFRGARQIPAVYAYGSDDEPSRVNWHFDDPFLVVERTARRFTLRLGEAVTGVFNEGFDPVGVSTPTGTSVQGVRRLDVGASE